MDQTSLTSTDTLHPNSKQEVIPQITYSDAEKKYKIFRRQRLIAARDARDMKRSEFDDMTFLKWYDVMKRADDQYVAPRKNKQDTSIETGTIRDKDTSLVEYATKYDFEPVAQVFDDSDDMLEELAESGEDMVRKSLMLEDAQSKDKLVYRSMITFGTALVEEQWIERWEIIKNIGKGNSLGSLSVTWDDEKVKTYEGCQSKLWDLRKCYFGDIRKFFMNGPEGQPYFFTVEYISYDMAKQIYGNWERFKFVSTTVVTTSEVSNVTNFSSSWTLRPISQNYVEVIRYYDPIANEFSISLNDIDMLPIMSKEITENGVSKTIISGFPLTEISPSGAIPFAKYDFEPMHDFTYSKGQPAKMRVFGDIKNMWFKLMLGMMKQKARPTMGNKSGKNFTDEVTDPATIINDIREGDLFPVLPNFQGASAGDVSFYELLNTELSKNSVEDSFQGKDKSDPNKETATQNMNAMKAQLLQVAALFDGIIAGNKQLYWLRTYNIVKNWTKPVDIEIDTFKKAIINKYRTVSVPTEVEGGQSATKKIIFTKNTSISSDAIHQKEVDYAKEKGGKSELRLTYLDPEQLRSIKLNWFYSCVPIPNGSDPLAYMMFAKQIVDAQTFFGPDSLNTKKLKYAFAKKTGNDFDTWFIKEQELEQKRQQAAQTANATGDVPGQKPGGNPTQAGVASGAIPGAGLGAIMK